MAFEGLHRLLSIAERPTKPNHFNNAVLREISASERYRRLWSRFAPIKVASLRAPGGSLGGPLVINAILAFFLVIRKVIWVI